MGRINLKLVARTLMRGLVTGILMIGTAIGLYMTMGPTLLAAFLFAVACFVIRVLASYI
jgi:hypothetical protein